MKTEDGIQKSVARIKSYLVSRESHFAGKIEVRN